MVTRKKVADETPKRKVSSSGASATRTPLADAAVGKPSKSGTRVKLDEEEGVQASTYFTNVDERSDLQFVSTGCAVFNCALGGGWVLGRVVNIVGDRSAGKTLLAIEACVNFYERYIKSFLQANGKLMKGAGVIRYAEAEAAFDEKYAEALGLPVEHVDFDRDNKIETVEDLYADIVKFMDNNKGVPKLYVLDSLDAISDEAELKREIGDASYGGTKPKKIGELFRREVQRMEEEGLLFIVVSQLRDKINAAMFGEKQTRSGGRALDFYASHIVWLAEIGKMKKTMGGVERVIGVNVRARVKKNKVGMPFRECNYPILLGYGVDDLTANVEWLIEVKCENRLAELDMSKAGYKVRISNLRDKGGQEVRDIRKQLEAIVIEEWQRIETGFLPKARKY
jgi:recombination protein RecA